MYKSLYLVILLLLCLTISSCGTKVDNPKEQEEKPPLNEEALPVNNGGKVVQYKDTVYFMKPYRFYDNTIESGALMAMKEDGSNIRRLYPKGGDKIYVLDNYLYASFPNETNECVIESGNEMTTYRISLDGKEVEALFEGIIIYFDTNDGAIYYIYNNDKTQESGLYKFTLEDKKVTNLYVGGCNYLGKEEDLIYFSNCEETYNDESEMVDATFIYSIHTNGTDLTLLDEDGKVTRYGKPITCFGICGDRILYCTGSPIMGTGYVGEFVSIKKDGTDKKRLEDVYPAAHFAIRDGWVYYGHCYHVAGDSDFYPKEARWIVPDGPYAKDSGDYYKVLPDLSEKQPLETDKMPICNARHEDDGYYYFHADYDEEEGFLIDVNIMKSEWDGSDKEVLVKSSDLFEWNEPITLTSSMLEIVDEWLYFDMEVSLNNSNAGYDFIEGKLCRMRLDGSGFQELSAAERFIP